MLLTSLTFQETLSILTFINLIAFSVSQHCGIGQHSALVLLSITITLQYHYLTFHYFSLQQQYCMGFLNIRIAWHCLALRMFESGRCAAALNIFTSNLFAFCVHISSQNVCMFVTLAIKKDQHLSSLAKLAYF